MFTPRRRARNNCCDLFAGREGVAGLPGYGPRHPREYGCPSSWDEVPTPIPPSLPPRHTMCSAECSKACIQGLHTLFSRQGTFRYRPHTHVDSVTNQWAGRSSKATCRPAHGPTPLKFSFLTGGRGRLRLSIQSQAARSLSAWRLKLRQTSKCTPPFFLCFSFSHTSYAVTGSCTSSPLWWGRPTMGCQWGEGFKNHRWKQLKQKLIHSNHSPLG